MDVPYFYIALFVHVVSLIVGFGSVLVIDSFGLLWLLKFKRVNLKLVTQVAEVTQVLIWLGWSGLVVSGLFLITAKGFVDNLTKIKLFFVLMVGLNGIFLHYIKKSMLKTVDENQVSKKTMMRMSLASFISQLGWWGAMSIGFLHRHWEHYIPWPVNWAVYPGVILLFIGTAALFIEGRREDVGQGVEQATESVKV